MNQLCYAGVDIGGTKIAVGLVYSDGTLTTRRIRPTPARQGPRAILAAVTSALREIVRNLPPEEKLVGIGVGTGGVVDNSTGVVLSANDLLPGWAGTRVRDELEEDLRVPVTVENDVNAFALGEHYFGAGRGLRDVLYVSIGTGVGGALILGGRLHRGAHHTAGEIGHWPLPDAAGRVCNCGHVGHVESVAAGPAITAWYHGHGGDRAVTDLREIAARAAKAESVAAKALTKGAMALGHALAGLVNVFDPQAVVIGGGVAEAGSTYWVSLEKALRAEALPGLAGVALHPAMLGVDAAVVGAVVPLLSDDCVTSPHTETDRQSGKRR